MTATLAVLLIITLLAMIFLPFGRSLIKDRAELHEIPMQCVEHVAAQLIANLRVQKPENAPFLPSENRCFRHSRTCVFVPANALRSFASELEANVGQKPVRGGEAIKTHRKVSDFQ